MRVERVEALAFGPLSGGVLEFAEGMTLVFGPNEAGKSSWHGALYAGACGLRRARGPRSVRDQEFESRHRPWGGGPWRARAVVALADGRRVELTQDLAARDGTARDLVTGRDVTSEILHEQVPDASRWLGLDRDAFRAVACVPQAALLQIRQQPGQLAEHLQRAAATAGTDATAAEAIKRLEDFLADQVGTERAWTRPLARARTELTAAQEALGRAREAHANLATMHEELRQASGAMESAEHVLRMAEAADARHRGDVAQQRWSQAGELAAKYPEPPAELAADDALAQRARAAVDGYRARPAVPVLEGPSAAELTAELTALPQAPTGDTTPAPEVEGAYRAVGDARAAVQSLAGLRRPFTAAPERTPELTSALRRLADALAEPLVQTPLGSEQPAGRSDATRAATSRPWLVAGAVTAAILLIAGVAAAIVARQPVGWVAVAAGFVIGAALLVAVLRGHAREIAALKDVQATGPASMRMAAERRLTEARSQAAALGLPADPAALREIADTDDRARAAADQWADWQKSTSEAEAGLHSSLGQLSRQLVARGVAVTRDPEEDFRRYRDQCARRGQQAIDAARRPDLESRLRDRDQAEGQAAEAATRRSAAERELRDAAQACHLPGADEAGPDGLADTIESWLKQRSSAIGGHEQAVKEYAVLQELLAGETLGDLKDEADRLADAASTAADGLDPAEIDQVNLGADPVTTLRELREAAEDARTEVTELRTRIQERAPVLGVAEADEAVAQASAQVQRLERLRRILDTARTFLTQAQDNVHRTIAPQLAAALGPHLGTVTAGRYTEVTVDPDDLQVRVRAPSGTWRDADRLSYGTAEQVYLLLRAALAQYLATTNETCPLILDDPTAYADDSRTTAVLQVLHHVSAERQVVVFSHDTNVLAWARGALNESRDKIIELVGLPSA
jgi:recombinational DNA repair ATPase RecF